jgi:hypothetical protein
LLLTLLTLLVKPASTAVTLQEGESWVSAVVEPSTGSSRLLIAGSSGHVYTHDLITNKVAKQVKAPTSLEALSMHVGCTVSTCVTAYNSV